jgi:hypothetical protein
VTTSVSTSWGKVITSITAFPVNFSSLELNQPSSVFVNSSPAHSILVPKGNNFITLSHHNFLAVNVPSLSITPYSKEYNVGFPDKTMVFGFGEFKNVYIDSKVLTVSTL